MNKTSGFYFNNDNSKWEPCYFHGFFQSSGVVDKYAGYERIPSSEVGAKVAYYTTKALIEVNGEMSQVFFERFRFKEPTC